jgi:excisionase family DNA binding protein
MLHTAGTIMDDIDNSHEPQVPNSSESAERKMRAYLTYEELSQQTGISVSTLRRRVEEGAILFFQPGGPRTRIVFPLDVVERLINQKSAPPEASTEPCSSGPKRSGPPLKWQHGNQK